jgi:hypothetical protein
MNFIADERSFLSRSTIVVSALPCGGKDGTESVQGLDLVLPVEFMNSTDVFSDHLGHGHIVYGKNIFFKITAFFDRKKHLPFLGGEWYKEG